MEYSKYIKIPAVLMLILFLTACKLGGEVSGIEKGESLLLMEDITGSTVTIKENGQFEFSEDFIYDTDYQVSVLKHSGEGNCRISNGQGTFAGDVQNVKVECEDLVACTMIYDPVCAKQETSISCITRPCPTHIYKTFGNACVAGLEKAEISFYGECGKLEGVVSGDSKPVRFLDEGGNSFPHEARVISAKFDGDEVEVEVGFSACSADVAVDMYVNPNFMKSEPVQVSSNFPLDIEGDVTCMAYFTKTVRFDLLPLKYRYMAMYQENGVINIQGVGLYKF